VEGFRHEFFSGKSFKEKIKDPDIKKAAGFDPAAFLLFKAQAAGGLISIEGSASSPRFGKARGKISSHFIVRLTVNACE